jgi:hypothetical protein
MVIEAIGEATIDVNAFNTLETCGVSDRFINVLARWMLEGEASEKTALLVERDQSLLDDVPRALPVDPLRIEYAAVVVERPDGLLVLPDDFLANKIGAAEIAVEIAKSTTRILQVMRPVPGCPRLRNLAAYVASCLRLDDELLEQSHDGSHLWNKARTYGVCVRLATLYRQGFQRLVLLLWS